VSPCKLHHSHGQRVLLPAFLGISAFLFSHELSSFRKVEMFTSLSYCLLSLLVFKKLQGEALLIRGVRILKFLTPTLLLLRLNILRLRNILKSWTPTPT